MKLLYSGASPFARKVRVLLHEIGQTGAVEPVEVTTGPMQTDPHVAAANPAGKIPALIRDDGPAIHDSRVICRYLDDRFGAGLYPAGSLWQTLTLEATADAIVEAALLIVYEYRFRSPEHVLETWVKAQFAKVERCVRAANENWMGHLDGPLDMGQIAMGCALGYLDLRHPDRNWREGNGALDDWYAAFSERDSMRATAPE